MSLPWPELTHLLSGNAELDNFPSQWSVRWPPLNFDTLSCEGT